MRSPHAWTVRLLAAIGGGSRLTVASDTVPRTLLLMMNHRVRGTVLLHPTAPQVLSATALRSRRSPYPPDVDHAIDPTGPPQARSATS